MMKFRSVFTSIVLLIFTVACFAADQGTIFIVRHAEKVSTAPDALLSAAGEERANCLAHLLRDANIQTIFTSDVKRTQQTARPLADERHLSLQIVPKASQSELIQKARSAAKNGDVLIVGHQETIAGIVQQLGGGAVPTVNGNEFDRMMILHLNGAKKTVTLLRYCDCASPARPPSQGTDQGMAPQTAPR